jgi:hypothetical protein
VQEHFLKNFTTLNKANKGRLIAAGFRPQEVRMLLRLSSHSKRHYANLIRKGMDPFDAADAVYANAKGAFVSGLRASKAPINITNTVNNMRGQLIRRRWIDPKTDKIRTIFGTPNTLRDNLLRAYTTIKQTMTPKINPRTKILEYRIDADDYQLALDELESFLTGDDKRDKIVLGVLDVFKRDAIKANPALKGANRFYSDARILQKHAVRFFQRFRGAKLEQMFRGINADTAAQKYRMLEEIKEMLGKELYDDIAGFYAFRNFDPTFHPSRAGLRRLIVQEIAKRRTGEPPLPVTQKLRGAIGAVKGAAARAREMGAPITRPIGKAAGVVGREVFGAEPYFSPRTRAGAQALLESRRGTAISLPGAIGAGVKKKPGKVLRLVHFSNQNKPSLKIDPKYMGTAQAGAEMQRAGPRTSAHYIEGTQYPPQHEYYWRFGGATKYISKVPMSKLYDWNVDKLNLSTKTSSAAERIMKAKGYWGYIAGSPPQVRLFKAVRGIRAK